MPTSTKLWIAIQLQGNWVAYPFLSWQKVTCSPSPSRGASWLSEFLARRIKSTDILITHKHGKEELGLAEHLVINPSYSQLSCCVCYYISFYKVFTIGSQCTLRWWWENYFSDFKPGVNFCPNHIFFSLETHCMSEWWFTKSTYLFHQQNTAWVQNLDREKSGSFRIWSAQRLRPSILQNISWLFFFLMNEIQSDSAQLWGGMWTELTELQLILEKKRN